MQIPERLEDWTLARIKEILRAGVFENDRFDFKEALPYDDKGRLRLRKSIAAFANSAGGFLVFGVKDAKGLSVPDRLIGIPATQDFPQHFGSYAAKCEPGIEWRFQESPIKLSRGRALLHVFEILSTWRKPHAVMQDGATYFVKRTNQGDEPMSFAEISGAFRESEFRRTGLALLISELEHMRSTAAELLEESSKGKTEAHPDRPWTWATRYSTTLLDTTLGNTFPFLATDPELWKLLCIIREKARSSNARSEAFAGTVFFRVSERIEIHDTLVRVLINCAKDINTAGEQAVKRLRELQ